MIETIHDHTVHPRYLGAQSQVLDLGRIVRESHNGAVWLPVHRGGAIAGTVRCYRRNPANLKAASGSRFEVRYGTLSSRDGLDFQFTLSNEQRRSGY